MKSVEHRFSLGETIQAAILKYNQYNMPNAIIEKLTQEYKKINEKHVPRVGDIVKIPIYSFIGQKNPVKADISVKKVPIDRTPITPPPITPDSKNSKEAEVVNFPKSIKDLDPKKVKVEDEETDSKIMLSRVERRRRARLANNKLVLSQKKKKDVSNKEQNTENLIDIIDEDVKEVMKKLRKDPQVGVPKNLMVKKKEKVKLQKLVEKKKKIKETVEAKKEPSKKVNEPEIKKRRTDRRRKDIDKAKLLNQINRNRRRR